VNLLLPSSQGKDWNEDLKDIKTSNTANLDEWRKLIETAKKNNIPEMSAPDKNRNQTDRMIEKSD